MGATGLMLRKVVISDKIAGSKKEMPVEILGGFDNTEIIVANYILFSPQLMRRKEIQNLIKSCFLYQGLRRQIVVLCCHLLQCYLGCNARLD